MVRSLVAFLFCTFGVCALSTSALAAPRLGCVVVLATHDARTTVLEIDVTRDANGELTASTRRAFSSAPAIVHAQGGAVRGALAGDDVLVTAQESGGRDRSFSGALWRVTRGTSLRVVDAVAYASRPLVVGRRAYVQRGRAGVERNDGTLRDDELVVTELDLDGGTTRVVAQLVGQLAYPVGVDDDAGLIVYVVTPRAPGDLLAFDLRSGASRELGTVGIARDFSLVPHVHAEQELGTSVVYEGREGGGRVVAALSLAGERTVLARSATALAPLTHGEQVMVLEHRAVGIEVPRAVGNALTLVQRFEPGHIDARWIVRAQDGAEVVIEVPGSRIEPVDLAP